ncbi:hypothetical protein RTH46_21490 [Pseudomonas sp. zfem004]|uniref:hypothetical protein n=1 Tax=unclassified Pseudomonas TaxID=196821 RepID=UPI00129B5BEB|nr:MULTISPECIES: hypothetical protein [unclassified Pseudomonas]MDU9405064.1 hypothetical protein [Pseudomonas sp. zfem004]
MNKPAWAQARLYNAGSEIMHQTGTDSNIECSSGGGFYPGVRYNFGNIHEIKRFWQAAKAGSASGHA